MADLLPCPFCGGPACLDTIGWFDMAGGCGACEFVGPTRLTKAEAIAAWNRRAAPAVPARTRWRGEPFVRKSERDGVALSSYVWCIARPS